MAEKSLNDVVKKLQDIESKISNVPTKGDSKLAAMGNALNLKALGDKIKAPFTSLKDSITGTFSNIKGAITAPFASLKDTLGKPFEAMKKGFGGIGNFFKKRGEKKELRGLTGAFERQFAEAVTSNTFLKELVGIKLYSKYIHEEIKKLTDSALNINDTPEAIGDDVSDIIKDGLPVKVVSLPETEDGNSLADQEDKKESRKLLVRIAKALESGGGGDGGPDVKASGKLGMLGKMGKGLGAGIGGLLKGIGGGFKYLGKNMGSILKGALALGAIGVSLIPAAFAFQEFGKVTWTAVAVGLTVLAGLAIAAAALSLASPAILIGAAAIAILALAMMPAALAFQMFAKAINEHVMPALAQLQPIVSEFIDRLVESFGTLAGIVQGFIAGTVDVLVGAFERGAEAIGGLIRTIAGEVKQLADLDGEELQSTAAGIVAVGAALAGFGAGGAVGAILGSIGEGFGKLFGAESPIDQLKTIADLGPRLAAGIKPIEELPKALLRLGDAISDGFDANIEDAGEAIADLLEEIEDGIDDIDFKKLEKLTGFTIQMGTMNNTSARDAGAAAAPTIINNYYDNSSVSSTNVNSTTLNETNIADDGTGTTGSFA